MKCYTTAARARDWFPTIPADRVLARLREVAVWHGADFVLHFTPEGHPYEPLIEG